MAHSSIVLRLSLLSLIVVGCADEPKKGDEGELESCTALSASIVVSAAGASVTGTTRADPPGTRALNGCGEYYPAVAAPPQDFVKVKVAADNPSVLHFTLLDLGTDQDFDTLVQVWDGCDEPPATGTSCFDDQSTDGSDGVSGGYLPVSPGQVLYFLITGVPGIEMDGTGRVSEGRYVAHFELLPLTQPTLLTASGVFDSSTSTLSVVVGGADSGADVQSLVVTSLLDAEGIELLDRDASGSIAPVEQLQLPFAETLGPEFSAATLLVDAVTAMTQYGIDIRRARQATLALQDAQASRSDVRVVTFDVVEYGEIGSPCDSDLLRCERGLLCGTDALCAVSDAAIAFCDGPAPMIELEAPKAGASTVLTESGVFDSSASGVLFGSCTRSDSAEQSFNVNVPEGNMDLVVRVTGTITGEPRSDAPPFDSVVYIRSTCADPSTEVACNDDGDPTHEEYWSLAQASAIAAGTYRVIAEFQGGLRAPYSAPYAIEFRLRSIVDEGEACDPDGVATRCATGLCVTEGSPSGDGVCRMADGSD